jgi:hypothetical protein
MCMLNRMKRRKVEEDPDPLKQRKVEEDPNPQFLGTSTGVGSSSNSCLSSNPSARLDVQEFAHHDVFLNHRGPDVKKTFVSHLNAALRRVGRDPFLDAESLVQGQHAFDSINHALIGVQVHVAIFSPGYAESKYCLNELCDMLASKKHLIPVFYDVEPEDLRWPENEEGPFARAFNHHIERGRKCDVERWKGALKEVANITGFRRVDNDR